MVFEIKSKDDLQKQIAEAGDKLIVIDFFATWCGPCKIIAPKLVEFSQQYPDIVFLKIDVDDNEDLASEYEIISMPTFVFIKNGTKVDSFAGANPDKITATILKHK